MSKFLHTRIFSVAFALLLLMLAMPEKVMSQKTMKVEGQVYAIENGKEVTTKKQYIIVKSSQAETMVKKIKSFGKGPVAVVQIEEYLRNEEIPLTSTANNGRFEEYVLPNSSFIFIDGLFNTQIEKVEDINRKKKIIFKSGGVDIKEVNISGNKTRKKTKIAPAIDTEYEVKIPIYAWFEKGEAKKNARLTIQPFIVDCATDDTLHYLYDKKNGGPLVYEGEIFHPVQDKRMDYDYFKNDSVAKYLHDNRERTTIIDNDTLLANGFTPDSILVDTFVIYKKTEQERKSKQNLKGCYHVILNDFTHEYYNNHGTGTGSCYRRRPLKFIDFSTAMVELPLSDEFKKDPVRATQNVPRDLKLKFKVGSAVLTDDSINTIESEKMGAELRSYGNRLWGVTVEGGASPDGNLEKNKYYAVQRAQFAKSLILQHTRGQLSAQDIEVLPPKVYTWEDAANELDKLGFKTEADTVRYFIRTRGENGNFYSTLRNLPTFETTIKVALENLRVMKCSYTYETSKILTPEEAADKYYNDPEYRNGTKHFSDGDFFNLFKVIKDSAELEKLIPFVYKEVTKYDGYETEKFSPYIAVRMANLLQKQGIVNTEILRPFISDLKVNEKDSTIDIAVNEKVYLSDNETYWIRNRREILINQAIMYFKSMALDTAQTIINLIPNDPDIRNLKHFVNFHTLYFRTDLTPEQQAEAEEAKDFIMSTSLENKAILHTELLPELKVSRSTAINFVEQMKDSDPRKWYLLGMLYADKDYVENEAELVYDESANKKRLDELMHGDESNAVKVCEKLNKDNFELYRLPTDKEEEEDYIMNHYSTYNALKEKYLKLEDEWLKENGGVKKKENKTKQFLAYFQHSFDLQPSYKLLYFEEGYIDEENVRKKYRYKRQEIPDYRDKFNTIMLAREYARKQNEKAGSEDEAESSGSTTPTTETNE